MIQIREGSLLYKLHLKRLDAKQLINDYAVFKHAQRPDARWDNVEKDIQRIRDFLSIIELHDLRSIRPQHFDRYKTARLQRVVPATLKRELNPVFAFFHWCYKRDVVSFDICSKVDNVILKKKDEVLYLDASEINMLLQSSGRAVKTVNQYGPISYRRSTPIQQMIAMALFSGLRLSEILHLRIEDVNLNKNYISVGNTADHTVKTLTSRRVPLSARLRTMIQCYCKALERDTGLMFTTRSGKCIHRSSARNSLKSAARTAGVSSVKANWNILRHTFASHLVSNGVSIYKVSKWLGHSSVTTTERYYAHLIPSMFDTDIDKVYLTKDLIPDQQ